jgi:hypothetical protein
VKPHCAHPNWIRRADEDVALYCRFRCADCGAPAWRRFNDPDSKIRPYVRPERIDSPSPQDLRIEERLMADRARGGAHPVSRL